MITRKDDLFLIFMTQQPDRISDHFLTALQPQSFYFDFPDQYQLRILLAHELIAFERKADQLDGDSPDTSAHGYRISATSWTPGTSLDYLEGPLTIYVNRAADETSPHLQGNDTITAISGRHTCIKFDEELEALLFTGAVAHKN